MKNGCIGKKGAGSAEGEPFGLPFARQLPEKNGKPKFQISAMGAGPMVLPRGVGGEKPPTQPPEAGYRKSNKGSRFFQHFFDWFESVFCLICGDLNLICQIAEGVSDIFECNFFHIFADEGWFEGEEFLIGVFFPESV